MVATTETALSEPVIGAEQDYTSVSEHLSDLVLVQPTPLWWYAGMAGATALFLWLIVAAGYLFYYGVGVWGVNIPVAWGWALANYVWWIGIASGGTFISSLFYIVGADWRNGVNRFAESLTLFAAAAAGLMPIFHLGRQGLFYWLFPYPNVMHIWPQFRSPLLWDFFALLAYILTSIVFWYIGLIPDCATLRDRATTRGAQIFYGILALGWRGSARHWRNYKVVYLVLAGFMAPMVVSVHSIVGLDFAAGLAAGWHSTQWPPYFFIGALYSGWASTLVLMIPIRRLYRLERIVTERHIEVISKLMLATGLLLTYCYALEAFQPYYKGDAAEIGAFRFSLVGPQGSAYWIKTACNVLLPQLLWFPAVRRHKPILFLLALGIVIGMWFERFSFVVASLAHDYIPSEFFTFHATIWDEGILYGSIGLVLAGFFLFIRFLPVVSIFELREVIRHKERR
ncbi:MAG TPA: NrfD/PsrC family molybdoenzyme membrane anchor subunit [Stellaceae bacterium]|jgi:molybdopterin-containing oxidoreductase family membrane subunit